MTPKMTKISVHKTRGAFGEHWIVSVPARSRQFRNVFAAKQTVFPTWAEAVRFAVWRAGQRIGL